MRRYRLTVFGRFLAVNPTAGLAVHLAGLSETWAKLI
jgi:hypothetical protein